MKLCETHPYETKIFSLLLAFLHTSFHHSSHTHLLERSDSYSCLSLTHTQWLPTFSQWIICFIYLCHPHLLQDRSLVCRLKQFVRSERCTESSRTIHCPQLIQGCLHHQLARCRPCSKWPLFSESNDKAVCIHSQNDSALTFTGKL